MSWIQALLDFLAQFNPTAKVAIWENAIRETYRPDDVIIWQNGRFCWVPSPAHVQVTDLGPGLHRRLPFVEVVHEGSVILQTLELQTQHVTSRDGRPVTFACNLAYRVTNYRNHVTKIHDFEHSVKALSEIYLAKHIREHEWAYLALPENQTTLEMSLRKALNKAGRRWGAKFTMVGLVTLVAAKQHHLFQTQENRGPY